MLIGVSGEKSGAVGPLPVTEGYFAIVKLSDWGLE